MASYPEANRYTKDHEWARLQGDTNVLVGITTFAKDQLGDVVYLELPEVGASVKRGEPFGVVESTKAVSELFAPVSGKVVQVNKNVIEAPERVSDDPMEKGWLIEIAMSSPLEYEALMKAKEYEELVKSES